MKRSKYGNKKITTADGKFDSIKELNRWNELKLLLKAGEISGLQRQVKFVLIPSQKINGKVVFREISYKADFVYYQNGKKIVEDCKGFKTKDYIMKKKMMYFFHKIMIKET